MPSKYITISQQLEKDFIKTCTLYSKTRFPFSSVYGKIVKSGNNKYIFIVSTKTNVKNGMSFWDDANKSKFKITHVNKKYKKYPENETSDFIYLDICDITYDAKKK